MEVLALCKEYFSGFKDISNSQANDSKANILGALKVVSYFTFLIPLGFAILYGAVSLYNRVTPKTHLTPQEARVDQEAQKTLGKRLLRRGKSGVTPPKTPSVPTSEKPSSPPNPVPPSGVTLSGVLNRAYNPSFLPRVNRANLESYSTSDECKRHQATARIYYNSAQLAPKDALEIVFRREPTNIAMGQGQYDQIELNKLFGYKTGVYNDSSVKKEDGSSFASLPNSATVYSETYLWSSPGGASRKEVAVLSVPAPALDSRSQPHYTYYMESGSLNKERYKGEMSFLFKAIGRAIRDNVGTAFNGTGIKRVVLSKFGQGAFLGSLSTTDRTIANDVYREQLDVFLKNVQDLSLPIVMSEWSQPNNPWYSPVILGDIITAAQEGDLIINAWDPHSAPGNGNDADASFDGAMGKGTGILLTQTSWFNPTLKEESCLVGIS